MNRNVLATRAAAAVAAAGIALTCAPAFAAAASTPADPSYVLDFTNSTFQAGDKAGTTVVGSGDILDPTGAKVGTVADNCGVVSEIAGGADTALCTMVLTLNDGDQITLSVLGKIDPTAVGDTFTGELEGGTGAYDGVKGDVVFHTVAPAMYQVHIEPTS